MTEGQIGEEGRVHRVRNRWGEVEEWVECTSEEWELAAEEERNALGMSGLRRFKPAWATRVSALPLWNVSSADNGWQVWEVPAANALEAIPKGMSGLEAWQLEMRVGWHAGAMWVVSRSGEPEHVWSVRERWGK